MGTLHAGRHVLASNCWITVGLTPDQAASRGITNQSRLSTKPATYSPIGAGIVHPYARHEASELRPQNRRCTRLQAGTGTYKWSTKARETAARAGEVIKRQAKVEARFPSI